MFKKLLLVIAIAPLTLFSKDYNIELLYGSGYMSYGSKDSSTPKGYTHDIGVKATIFSSGFSNELAGRYTGFSKLKNKTNTYKQSGWELEYRFGTSMEDEMKTLGMIMGNAYLGIGYQQFIESYYGKYDFIYMPFGFWTEDKTDINWLTIRSGINIKLMFFSKNNKESFKYTFGLGGKIYVGTGFILSEYVSLFTQAYFVYNTPVNNIIQGGIEAGIQF